MLAIIDPTCSMSKGIFVCGTSPRSLSPVLSNHIQTCPLISYGIHEFDWVTRTKPAVIEAKRDHPARMATPVFGPGGL